MIQEDLGIIQALLQESSFVQLPRLLTIRNELAAGKPLDDKGVALMHKAFKTADHLKPYVDRHIEYQDFYAREIMLFHEITSMALANELNPTVLD